jgi:hypothetical protein
MAGECIECNRPIMCADCDDLLRAHMIYGVHSPGLARLVALEELAKVAEDALAHWKSPTIFKDKKGAEVIARLAEALVSLRGT